MKQSFGFTLIEILVVILIIGITLGFAMIAFGDFGESRRIMVAAEQLSNTIELAQQQAILENSTLGLRVDNEGYQILKFQQSNKWSEINHAVFKRIHFPKNTLIHLHLTSAAKNFIVLSPTGDMTPFSLDMGNTKNPKLVILIGKSNGNLILSSGQN